MLEVLDYVKLSKKLSYALRHAPWEYELELDEQGFVLIEQLLYAFCEEQRWKNLCVEDLRQVVQSSDKSRFEIVENKIRALYGHSILQKILKESAQPPEFLYHGTTRIFAEFIMKQGLQPKGRQYVHLSVDTEMALQVGRRRAERPILLKVYAVKAYEDGVAFYRGNERVWLADLIEPKYLEVL